MAQWVSKVLSFIFWGGGGLVHSNYRETNQAQPNAILEDAAIPLQADHLNFPTLQVL